MVLGIEVECFAYFHRPVVDAGGVADLDPVLRLTECEPQRVGTHRADIRDCRLQLLGAVMG